MSAYRDPVPIPYISWYLINGIITGSLFDDFSYARGVMKKELHHRYVSKLF